ncbi:unnamed protein product [Pleuronectes platessa]|uniref:Uncharacterized protein n=1 Tax=Pleuronectes platessa TaxID=8262 RepID=A0A9N7U3P8_PLEPL|nr:unnamed protein product [Pleuronectes platessa]
MFPCSGDKGEPPELSLPGRFNLTPRGEVQLPSSPSQGNVLPIQALPASRQASLEPTADLFQKAATRGPASELQNKSCIAHKTTKQEPHTSKTTSATVEMTSFSGW